MNIWNARLELLISKIKESVPKFEVLSKDKSKTQRFLGWLLGLFGMSRYMEDFWTTFYPNVYSPAKSNFKEDPESSFHVLAHEYVHLLDTKKNGAWFRFSYILPQVMAILSVFSLLAIWFGLWWLFSLCAILFILPIPAYFRMKIELRGYAMGMATRIWMNGKIEPDYKEYIMGRFVGFDYYKMWPFKGGMMKRINDVEKSIHSGDILKDKPYSDVYNILKLSEDKAISMVSSK